MPKLRFPEFEQSWEEIPLGELGQFFRGLTYGADDVASEGLLVLRSSNIQGGQLVLDSDLVFVTKRCPPEMCLKRGDITPVAMLFFDIGPTGAVVEIRGL